MSTSVTCSRLSPSGNVVKSKNRSRYCSGIEILFASDQRVKIEGNLRRVQERMIERGLDAQFDMQYSFRL
ncbi:MAG: hypothetical protein EOO67_03710, partial [Microbacterium sp.]